MTGAETFTCPCCGAVSASPYDIREGYCTACHDFTGGSFSALAYEHFLKTGEIPEWRAAWIVDRSLHAALREAIQRELEP